MNAPMPRGQYTPVPDYLFDVVMPTVSDPEWRLISIIVRQTLGWHEAGGRSKERDWLSHAQLKTRMNRSSATVSKTIDSLVKKGLIDVETSSGKHLSTALERRNCHARMYFRLNRTALGSESAFH